jgi:hypothetical protein
MQGKFLLNTHREHFSKWRGMQPWAWNLVKAPKEKFQGLKMKSLGCLKPNITKF